MRPRSRAANHGTRDELSDAQPIGGNHRLDAEGAVRKVPEETHLGFRAETGTDRVDHLGDDEHGHNQPARMRLEEFPRRRMGGFVGIDVRIQRPGVDDQRSYRETSAERISSIHPEMSARSLRPAPAAARVRRPRGPAK